MFIQCHHRAVRIFFSALLAAGFRLAAADSSAVGIWKTIDDKTHAASGTVRLYEQNGAVFGRIETSVNPKDATEVCDLCKGDRHNQPIIGLVFLRNMKKQGDEYAGGDILDPKTGQVYKCRMALTEDGRKLVVRGFVGFSLLGRSQTWIREK